MPTRLLYSYSGSFLSLLVLLTLTSPFIHAQIPSGYYESTGQLKGAELKTALYHIVKNHTVLAYSELWAAFTDTDKKSNGKVWDMYSDKPGATPPYEYSFGTNQCGSYSKEGDCFNREHTVPQSWFGNSTYPMYSDLFHIVPTDGFVNAKRGNFPYGEVNNASWTSMNGSKLGPGSWPGYSGTVFEPLDEYKGDFARGLLYMVTRYENIVAGWNSEMLNKTAYPAFTQWAIELLLQWHRQDPVSTKEINRNNAIYAWQNNRNPFIDNPGFAERIWGEPAKYALIIDTDGKGTTNPAPGEHEYDQGTFVVIKAIADTDWKFDTWIHGQSEYPLESITMLLDKDMELKARFVNVTAVDPFHTEKISFSPNPFGGYISISEPGAIHKMYIRDMMGVMVMIRENPGENINTHMLSPGLYFITTEDKSGRMTTRKMLKVNP
jgi:endonuclease I